MSYRIRHKDATAQAAVRRIARDQVEGALRSIDERGPDPAGTIHDVRKRCKKIRGLLRLVRPVFDGYGAENAAFRDTAGSVGALRDAEVLVGAFDHVVEATGGDDAGRLTPIRQRLCDRRATINSETDADTLLMAAGQALEAAMARIEHWQLARGGFAAFEEGLVASYRRGRKAMRAACRGSDDEAFHTWRKRCKDHAFHLRLLAPIWSGPMRAQRACAESLGELLGLHHDLAALAGRAREMTSVEPEAIDELVTRIRTRQRELAREAGSIGARLYAERSSALGASWRRRYEAWRKEGRDALR
jgi:CHAD domain-containing protein